MKSINKFIILSIITTFSFLSCKDDPETKKAGDVTIEFEHVWASSESEFSLNKALTHPLLSETMTFNIFKYYVSNIRLKSKEGSWYAMPESYFIVDTDPAGSSSVVIPDVPGGEYTDVEITFGVDSLRSTSGAQTGALSVTNGMFWSWNSGYIMLKAEGTSPNAAGGSFTFHLGGFKGVNKVQSTKEYNLGSAPLVVDGDREAEIHMVANPAKLWHSAEKLAVRSTMTMPGEIAKTMSSTFYDAIRFDHIHN